MCTKLPVMQILSSPAVSEAEVMTALQNAFLEVARGETELADQHVVKLPGGGDVIHYPGVLASAGMYAVKVSPYIPQLSGAAIVTAWTMLISLATGEPVALLNSSALTAERTAATSLLAAGALLPRTIDAAAVIGYGPVGRAHVRYLRRFYPHIDIRVAARSMPENLDSGMSAAVSVDEAVKGAQLVMLCTSASDTVIDPRDLPAGTVVTSISTDAAGAREIPAEAIRDLDVYIDAPSTLTVAADLVQAAASGWDSSAVRGDLAGLVAGTACKPSGERPVFFRSVGLGIEDAAVALAALQ